MRVLQGILSQPRGAAALVLGIFVAGGLIVIFAGALARATELEREAEQARRDVAGLRATVEAGVAEADFILTDRFVEQQARAVGYGTRGERPFRLPESVPSPDPIDPLGGGPTASTATTPLEAWVRLLFG
jgi:hypothetical protein